MGTFVRKKIDHKQNKQTTLIFYKRNYSEKCFTF